jgi:hypothetical protein
MEDDFYYGELPELPPPVANTTPELVDENDNPVENPDLELGWLKNETKTVHHDAIEGVEEQFHYETIAEYPNGGKDVKKVIDVPGVEAKDAWDEEVPFQRYILYTNEELAQRKAEQEAARKKQEVLDKLPETLAALTTALNDADALNVDQEYRLTLLELGIDGTDNA